MPPGASGASGTDGFGSHSRRMQDIDWPIVAGGDRRGIHDFSMGRATVCLPGWFSRRDRTTAQVLAISLLRLKLPCH